MDFQSMQYLVTQRNNFFYILMDSGVFIEGDSLAKAVPSGSAFIKPWYAMNTYETTNLIPYYACTVHVQYGS